MPAAAAELAGEALVLAEDLGDRRAEAAARTVRATIDHHAGRSRDALVEYHRVLDLAGDLGEPYLEVEANVGLTEVHIALEARSLASVHARQALSSQIRSMRSWSIG